MLLEATDGVMEHGGSVIPPSAYRPPSLVLTRPPSGARWILFLLHALSNSPPLLSGPSPVKGNEEDAPGVATVPSSSSLHFPISRIAPTSAIGTENVMMHRVGEALCRTVAGSGRVPSAHGPRDDPPSRRDMADGALCLVPAC